LIRTESIGLPHRVLETVVLLVYEYDALGVGLRTLRAGTTFQPWAPLCAERVPITLGESAAGFAWNAASPTGHFLWRDDFVERCARTDEASPRAASRTSESPIASPFAHLDAIGARLLGAARDSVDRAMVEDALAKLATIHTAHTRAAEMQRAAEGFDNTGQAREHAQIQAQLLAEARQILGAAQARVRAEHR
jgi:hypothetical protein